MIRLRSKQGERGAAALSLLTVGIIVALGIVAAMAIPLTRASDAKAKSNSAADAAALAGVEYVKNDLKIALTNEGWLGDWTAYQPFIGGGRDSAIAYAERNEARLLTYQPPTPLNGWTARTEVEGRSVEGEAFTSKATARLDLPDCTIDGGDDFEPAEPEPTEPPPPGEPTEPAEPVVKTIDCAGLQADVEVVPEGDGEAGLPKVMLPPDFITQLIDESHAKLVG